MYLALVDVVAHLLCCGVFSNVKERIIVRAIENKVAIYSPHTALDAVNGGSFFFSVPVC